MPTERPQQANLLWLVGGLAVLFLIAWQPASGAALLVAITVAGLALALAHDYWSVALPGWQLARRAGLVVGCAALGLVAFVAWIFAPIAPAAAVLIMALVLHSQRGRWPNAVDRLTGLPTAVAFAARGTEELSRGLRHGRPAIVAVIAIENASDIIAHHGRKSLDQALLRATDALRQHSRGYDLLGRLSDARFALLLPETSQDDALTVVERIRTAIEQIQSAPGGDAGSIRLTVSLGLATHPWDGDSVRALVNKANAEARSTPRGTPSPLAATEQRADAPNDTGTSAAGTSAQAQAAIKAPIAVRLFTAPSWSVPAYFAFIWVVTIALFAGTFSFEPRPSWPIFLTLLLVAMLARYTAIPVYGRVTVTFQFVSLIAASLLLGPTYAFLLGAAAMALTPGWKQFRLQPYIFDVGQAALITGTLALATPPIRGAFSTWLPEQVALAPLGLALGGLCYLLNAGLLIAGKSLHEGANPLAIWRERISWFLPYTLAFGLLGTFMAWSAQGFGALGIIIFAIPAFMIHLVTKQYVDRTKEHVAALHEAHDRLAALNQELNTSVEAVERSYSETLSAFSGMLDARDSETEGHSQRVVAYALAIGQALGLGSRELAALKVGALLHDIGKVGIADAILHKPGKLSEQEWNEMRRHPEIGHQLTSRIPFLDAASPVVRYHHERWDGTGYPDSLRGEDIPLAARIFAIADAYDALVSDRPYRHGRSHLEAVEEIRRCAGSQFDPHIVDVFLQLTSSGTWSEEVARQSEQRNLPVRQLIAR
jgi:diguanylate cyclase (GGDEF)-like protein